MSQKAELRGSVWAYARCLNVTKELGPEYSQGCIIMGVLLLLITDNSQVRVYVE